MQTSAGCVAMWDSNARAGIGVEPASAHGRSSIASSTVHFSSKLSFHDEGFLLGIHVSLHESLYDAYTCLAASLGEDAPCQLCK